MSRWSVRVTTTFERALGKLSKENQHRVLIELSTIESLANPKTRGKSLTGSQRGYWRYRVGDYRVICEIRQDELIILALTVGHRSQVYRP